MQAHKEHYNNSKITLSFSNEFKYSEILNKHRNHNEKNDPINIPNFKNLGCYKSTPLKMNLVLEIRVG